MLLLVLNFLPQPLQTNAWLSSYVLLRRSQRLESLVTYITEVNPLSLVCFVPLTDSIQNQHEFPHKPALDIFRFRYKQMSTPLHVPLKADPSLEGNTAKLHAINLARYLSCSIFEGRMDPWTTNMCLDRLEFREKFLLQWLHCSGKQGRVASGR